MEPWSPRSFQRRAIKVLLSQAAVALFMKPGLGKTSTALAAFKVLKKQGLAKKMLVVAPLRPAYETWPAEIAKWDEFNSLTYSIIHDKKEAALEVDADIYIINPEGLLWLLEKGSTRISRWDFSVLVVDESTKFKNSASKRFKLLKKELSRFSRRWILTGSPQPKWIMDLFAQIYLLDQGNCLGPYVTHFRNKYFYQPNPYKRQYEYIPHDWAFDEIVSRIDPLVVYVDLKEYVDMPELIVTDIVVRMPPEVTTTYKAIEDEFIALLDGGVVVAQNAAAAGTKCRQVANGAVYLETNEMLMGGQQRPYEVLHDKKIEALKDLIEEIGEPTIVAYEYQHDVERITKAIPNAAVIRGGTSAKRASEVIAAFNLGNIDVLVGHPASMGHGLNLQAKCSNIIFFGITWDYEHYEQIIARIWRQGQASKRVMVYHIVCADTLDEKVVRVLKDKERNQQKLLESLTGGEE